MKPVISIITSTLNAGKIFAQTAESIRSQTSLANVQWLISDGLSTDNTIELIKQNQDIIDYWHSQKDNGVYSAWNTLLPKIKGEWVMFLGADDVLADENIIASLISKLSRIPQDTQWVYGQVLIIGDGYKVLAGEPWQDIQKNFFSTMSVPHQGVLVRNSLIKKIGGFAENYKIAGDFDFLVRAVMRGFNPCFISKVLVNMSAIGISSSPANGVVNSFEALSVRKTNNIKPIYSMFWCWVMIKSFLLYSAHKIFGVKITAKIFCYFQLLFDKKAQIKKT